MKDDVISRQAAIRWVKTECNPYGKPTLDFESGKKVIEHLKNMPPAQPTQKNDSNTLDALDCVSRQAAIDALIRWYGCEPSDIDDFRRIIEELPSAQPERLTDDDFETIRIHLNAFKENLCNQQRWGEAEEYQRIIDRFIALASAQPEHGRWIDVTQSWKVRLPKTTRTDEDEYAIIWSYISTYKCSVCHMVFQKDYKYCPNCGARMDEEADHDDHL